MPVYLPVYAVPALLFPGSRRRLLRAPLATGGRILKGVATSTAFLASYTSVALLAFLGMRRHVRAARSGGALAHWAIALAGSFGGIAALLEKKSRRIELGLYIMSKAVYAAWAYLEGVPASTRAAKLYLGRRGPRTRKRRRWGVDVDVCVFSAAFAVIMHAYVRHPHMIRRAYRGVLARFFDSDRRHKFL